MKEGKKIIQSLTELGNAQIAERSKVFFKTKPGEYAEADKFLGIRVPILRKQVKKHKSSSLSTLLYCLKNEFHEIRLFALLSLIERFKAGSTDEQEEIFQHYIKNTKYINNWDLVDSSAPYIVGSFLHDRERKLLYQMADSALLWDRRIAIISTHFFIKHDDFQDCLNLSEILLEDTHDLIHKAVGWMLREIGKRNKVLEIAYLKKNYHKMPRTMLRYAIEHFSTTERQGFLKGSV